MAVEHNSKAKKTAQAYGQAGPYIGLGIQFALSILLCLYAGWWLDQKISTTPIFIICGTFLGAGMGFYSLYRTLLREEKKRKEKEEGAA